MVHKLVLVHRIVYCVTLVRLGCCNKVAQAEQLENSRKEVVFFISYDLGRLKSEIKASAWSWSS